MQKIAEETRLPVDIDAQPLVQAAAALRPVIRSYHEEIERDQHLPKALVEQLHAAGFYRLVIPRELGGLQADPLTYLRVVELLSEGAGSVGWNLANNSIGQLITLGLPDEGVHEIYAHGVDTVIAGTAVQGGGQAVPVAGGYRVSGRWRFGSGCQESSWMLGSFQILDDGQPRRNPDGTSVYWRGVFPRSEAQVVEGSWDVSGLRGTGSFDWTVEDVFLPERRTMAHAGAPLDNQWKRWPGVTYAFADPGLGRAPPQRRDHRHRAGRHRRTDRASRREDTAWPDRFALRESPGPGRRWSGRRDAERRARLPQRDDRRALEHGRGRQGDHPRATGPLPVGRRLRSRQCSRGDGPDVPARWQHVVPARQPPGRVLARPARRRPDGHDRAGVVPHRRSGAPGDGPRPAHALATTAWSGRRPGGRVNPGELQPSKDQKFASGIPLGSVTL